MELSQRELQRVKVIENAVWGRTTVVEASSLLQLSPRQVKRPKARYEPGQVDWVRHGNRGRPGPWAISQAVQKRIVELARAKYAGFNDSYLTEKLVEAEKITVSRETVRRLLRQAKLRSPHRAK
jgi:transposase